MYFPGCRTISIMFSHSANNWRAGASLPSRPNGAIFLCIIYLYISGVDVCRNVLRNSK